MLIVCTRIFLTTLQFLLLLIGEIINESAIAGNNGTTITVTDLFKKLPVEYDFVQSERNNTRIR